MADQKTQPDLNELIKHADKYLQAVIALFQGIQEKVDETKTDPDTWAAATDDVTDEGPEPEKPTANDLYVQLLERRAYEHARRGEVNAAAAIRRIINELRELDNFMS